MLELRLFWNAQAERSVGICSSSPPVHLNGRIIDMSSAQLKNLGTGDLDLAAIIRPITVPNLSLVVVLVIFGSYVVRRTNTKQASCSPIILWSQLT